MPKRLAAVRSAIFFWRRTVCMWCRRRGFALSFLWRFMAEFLST
jgi:hypothetical protein